jgi:predicted RNA-binding protein YlqC (UPF0109 family)
MTGTDIITLLAKELVDYPENVRVDKKLDKFGLLIDLHVDQKDLGIVIGHKGETARALRTILHAVSTKNGEKANLRIFDPNYVPKERRAVDGITAPSTL